MEYGIDNTAADNSRYGTKNQDTQLSADGHDYQSPDSVLATRPTGADTNKSIAIAGDYVKKKIPPEPEWTRIPVT